MVETASFAILFVERKLTIGICGRFAVGQLRRDEPAMEKRAEQFVRLSLHGIERLIVEHELAHAERHVGVVGQTNARLLRAQIHDHDSQLHVGRRLLLSTEARGQLIAGVLDPGTERGGQATVLHRVEQLAPLGFIAKARPLQKLLLVFRAEAAANHAGARGQSKVVVEKDTVDADRLDLPHRLAVLLRWRAHGARCPCRWTRPAARRISSRGSRSPDVPAAH